MHTSVIWSVDDFSVNGNLSGYFTKNQHACPICGLEYEVARLLVSRNIDFHAIGDE